jgi:mono/diheme cytochrome c family protein
MQLKRTVLIGGVTACALMVAQMIALQAQSAAGQPAAVPDKKIWDGVYTTAQAERGRPRFEASCIRCHNTELIGSERGPALKGNVFWSKYENDSLASLYTLIRDTMPRDGGAGVVSDEIKIDILAYILMRNEIPAGSEELKLNATALEGIKITKKTVQDGVYTTAQADRGKANFLSGRCGGCHQLDLSGDRGPALKGDAFLAHWDNGSLSALFRKISEGMPPNAPNETTDDAKIDIVAYLLQSNGFPAGKSELRLDAEALEAIEIARKGSSATAPNFALVQVVGCLSQNASNTWVLTNTTEPVVTKQEAATPAALREAQGKTLGSATYQLVSVKAFKPESHKGQRMEARGLLYRDASDALLNLTSLQTVGNCNN